MSPSENQTVEKAPGALKTIREVAEILELPTHVLRFWETKFPQIQPLKRAGGRRFYRNEDVDALLIIRDLVHHKKYTIKGAQAALPKLLKEKKDGVRPVQQVPSFAPLPAAPQPSPMPAGLSKGDISLLFALRDELYAMQRVLQS